MNFVISMTIFLGLGSAFDIFSSTSLGFSVLCLAAFAAFVSEKSGMINVGIEGMLVAGALVFSIFGSGWSESLGNGSQILALFLSGLAGVVVSFFYGIAVIWMGVNQILVGFALNILVEGIATYIAQNNERGFISSGYSEIGFAGLEFFNIYLLLTLLIGMIIWLVFSCTLWGKQQQAVGENLHAAHASGINIQKRRWIAIFTCGFVGGIGGGIFPFTVSQEFYGSVYGRGFIALAILILGQWKIVPIVGMAGLFSFVDSFASRIVYFENLPKNLALMGDLFHLAPFLFSLIALMIFAKSSRSPGSLGEEINFS